MQIALTIAENPWVLSSLVIAIAAATAYVHIGPKSQRIRRLGRGFTFLTFALILAGTLYPTGASGTAGPSHCVDSLSSVLTEPTSGGAAQGVLNVLLFVPCALVLASTAKHPLPSLLALAATSAAIEVIQSMLGSHTCSGADWRANIIGCICGGAVGMAARYGWHRYSQRSNSAHVIPSTESADALYR